MPRSVIEGQEPKVISKTDIINALNNGGSVKDVAKELDISVFALNAFVQDNIIRKTTYVLK